MDEMSPAERCRMSVRIPSTGSLRAFEAAARHLNFTRAATELGLTQTAVSHQIKSLESQIGSQLFVRDPAGLVLTDIGRDYLSRISPALFKIAEATGRAQELNNEKSLVVASLGTYSTKCLLPKLPAFKACNPDIRLRLLIADSFDRLDPNSYDIGIRYGTGDWPRLQVDRLTHEQAFPVCSPDFLPQGMSWRSPKDLLNHTLIRIESQMLRDLWPLWFEAHGLHNVVAADEIRCNRLSVSLQAAIDGVGVAIARSSVATPDLRSGQLVAPFPDAIDTGGEGYYLVTSPERAETRKVKLFRAWALATLRTEPDDVRLRA
jgi:LysR family transcriptional regulator, glycine cleavage system transcriptional activator